MSRHPMRKKKKEITDQPEVLAVLQQAEVLHLAMVDGQNPYVLPFNFGYEEGRIYIHCAKEGRKLDVLAANPRVAFEAQSEASVRPSGDPEDACGWGMRYRCVAGEGVARVTMDRETVRTGLSAIMRHYAGRDFDFPDRHLERTAMIVIEVRHISGKQDLD